MADAQILRQLKIKTGSVNRLFKEVDTYREEVVAAKQTLDKLKAEGADGADIRNAERVVQDSAQMIPRTRKQLEETLLALQDLLDGLKGEEAVVETAEYKDAAAAVQKVEEAWAADK